MILWSLIGLFSFILLMIKQVDLIATDRQLSVVSLVSKFWVNVWPRTLVSEGLDLRGYLVLNFLNWDIYTEDILGHTVNVH